MMVFGDELLLVGIKQMSWWIFYKVCDGVQLVVGQITEGAVVAVDASARTAFPYQQRRYFFYKNVWQK